MGLGGGGQQLLVSTKFSKAIFNAAPPALLL